MSPSGRVGRAKPKSDSTALALMVGMIFAVAVTAAASFSAAGSGALQQGLKAMGFGRDSEIQAEQRKHAVALAEFERILTRMDNEIGGLTTRITRTESDETAVNDRLAKLDGGLAAVTTDIKELRVRSETAGGDAWRKPVDHLNAAVAGARSDIIALRSSIDAYDQRRGDVGALAKRIQRLEQAIIAREATSSIPDASQPSRDGEGDGLKGLFGLRGSGAGSGHVIDMGAGH
jgi:chromosome segregation ATPase